jgi:plastocyanin
MKLSRLVLALWLSSLAACFDFDATARDGGPADAGQGEDAGLDAGTTDVDAGAIDAGPMELDAGPMDAGTPDAGTPDAGPMDAGCGGAAQLAIISPPQSVGINVCSAVVRVQLQDTCGAPALAANNVPLSFTSPPTMQLFSDSACTTMPFNWSIAAGTNEVDLHVMDSAPGMPVLSVRSAGLDGGSQAITITCAAGQRACPGLCVPTAGCCDDMDCTASGLPWVCNASHLCAPPPCGSFPANCSVFDDRTAPGASRTITFDSSGYVPKCMRVTTSQDVTFSGTFGIHPLQQVCGPSNRQMTTTFGITKTVRFADFGTYGYRCANHPVFEQGAIRVP